MLTLNSVNILNCTRHYCFLLYTKHAFRFTNTILIICIYIVNMHLDLLALFLEKAMATHSSTLAWKLPWMEEPGRLQSMGSRRVRHDWATSLSLFTFMRWRRKWQPAPVFLPGESQGRGSLVGCRLWGRTESARLKRSSSSSSTILIILYSFLYLWALHQLILANPLRLIVCACWW